MSEACTQYKRQNFRRTHIHDKLNFEDSIFENFHLRIIIMTNTQFNFKECYFRRNVMLFENWKIKLFQKSPDIRYIHVYVPTYVYLHIVS